jgi:hypothetical protein
VKTEMGGICSTHGGKTGKAYILDESEILWRPRGVWRTVLFILFFCGLFNGAVSSSDYIASSDRKLMNWK